MPIHHFQLVPVEFALVDILSVPKGPRGVTDKDFNAASFAAPTDLCFIGLETGLTF